MSKTRPTRHLQRPDTARVADFGPGVAGPRSVGPLSDALVEAGLLSGEQVSLALATAEHERLSFSRVLVRDGLVLSRQLAAFTALHLGLDMVDLRSQPIDPSAVRLLPEDAARRYAVLPVAREGPRLKVAMVDPLDFDLLGDLAARTSCTVAPVVATVEDILEHIDVVYRLAETSARNGEQASDAPRGGKITAGLLRSSPPAQVVDMLLRQGIQDRASDVHIEPTDSRLRVRFRIDGILHDVASLPLEMHPPLVSRLKIMAGMNIAERRRPQDGQITFDLGSRKVDVRVAISSTVADEMVVLRLLDKSPTLLGLDQLGMNPGVRDQWRTLLRLPHGMLIVCGPTGAGKSSTLYASALQMNRSELNIISLEDPVEYRIADANQMQIRAEAGVTFASQLRSVLRLDPDVVIVGEIRDHETATIAIQAALTGHLVLTSLHANDSVSALLRLRELGVAPYLTASSVAGILSQRMVRLVCQGCRATTPRPLAEQRVYAEELGESRDVFMYGTGCNQCAQTGYRGRTGVFELLTISDVLRQLFLADEPRSRLWQQAQADGTLPLRRDAMVKVRENITTPYEVMRVLFRLE